MRRFKTFAAALGAATLSIAVPVAGQLAATSASYPAKPIRILVPTPPCGGNDIMARMAAQKMNERWSYPVVAESGLPGYEASTWWGILAPRGTQASIVKQLNEVISNAITAGDVRGRIAALGAQPAGGPPQQLATLIRDELPKWTKVIKEAGIRLE